MHYLTDAEVKEKICLRILVILPSLRMLFLQGPSNVRLPNFLLMNTWADLGNDFCSV